MNQTCFISRADRGEAGWQFAASDLYVEPTIKGGVMAVDAVYTNAPTQPQIAQASGLCITRGKRKYHGVRTNG